MKLKILILLIISGLTFGQTLIKPEIDTLKMKVPNTIPTEVGQVGMFINGAMSLEKVYTQSQVEDQINRLDAEISASYATQASIAQITLRLNTKDTMDIYLLSEITRLEGLINANINPFPSAPTNLEAYNILSTTLGLTWDYSGIAIDSYAVYIENISTDPPTAPSYYTTNDSLNISGLTASANYNFWVKAIIDSFYSGSSNIINVTTVEPQPSEFIPNLAGYLDGSSLGDFSLTSDEGDNAISISNNTYATYYDSSSNFLETAYGRKVFTIPVDSIFIGTKVIMPISVNMLATNDEHILLSLIDTVANAYVCAFGLDDGDANRSADRWYFRYKHNGGDVETTSSTAFNLSTTKYIEIGWIKDTGVIQVYVNDTLVIDLSSRVLSAYSPNAVAVGNHSLANTNDYAVNATFYFDNIYADSSSFASDGWQNIENQPSSGDATADYYVDYINGNDGNDGSAALPFKHCPHDINATGIASTINLVAGDTVAFKGGVTYLGQINLPSTVNGTRALPIVLTGGESYGFGTGNAIIDLEYTRSYGISIASDWVTIKKINVYNLLKSAGYGAISIGSTGTVHAVQGIVIDSCIVAFCEGWGNISDWADDGVNVPAAVHLRGASHNNITIKNSEFYAWRKTLINLENGVDSCYIQNNIFGGLPSVRGDSSGWYGTAIRMNGGTLDTKHIFIQDNEFADAWKWGGDVDPELSHTPTKIVFHTQSVGTWRSARDVVIERNRFWNDKQFSTGSGTGDISIGQYSKNVSIRNNLFINTCSYAGWSLMAGSTGTTTNQCDSIYIENNTFVMRDYTSDAGQKSQIVLYSANLGDSVFIRNNLFLNLDGSSDANCIRNRYTGDPNIVIDYNAYYNFVDSTGFFIDGATDMSLSEVQTTYGLDMHSQYFAGSSVFTDFPLVANTSGGDYSLNSSASTFLKSGGQVLNYRFTTDFNGVTIGAAWSIGAIKYVP